MKMDLMYLLSSFVGSFFVLSSVVDKYVPYSLRVFGQKLWDKITTKFQPYIDITIDEYRDGSYKRNELYTAIQNYLSTKPSKLASRLKLLGVKNSKSPVLSLDDGVEVIDEYSGVKIWWYADSKNEKQSSPYSYYTTSSVKRFYTLTFHRNYRDLITESYLNYVIREGNLIEVSNRKRKLYSNASSEGWWGKRGWINVNFEHPATFDTLAMHPKKKQEIMNDLTKFKNGKAYYAKIGKAWKRGYLLYGPPGTGKSTMIAAMSNFLDYDVYDLELTAVNDNTDLRKLLISTSSKSIIVIEDIDCSLNLTAKRKVPAPAQRGDEEKKTSRVTLSGLLNFIDGIWSACGGERLIVFTTNYVEKLDAALIRRGRMDKHIQLSYCCFEAFKVLAKNYLNVESHELFLKIESLLGETNMTPADVAENLMPKSDNEDADSCLNCLIEALEKTKEDERKKAEEEAKAEGEAKTKAA
ncbi:hypothetical protein UlMin_014870 [Ulmus minor]